MKKTAIRRIVLVVAVFFAVTFSFTQGANVFAQTTPAASGDVFGVQSLDQTLPLPQTDIRVIIARVINIFLGLLGLLTVILIMYAGYLIMTSNGNEEQVSQGRTLIRNAVIGLIIILSAFALTRFIIGRLSGAVFGGGGQVVDVPQGPIESFGGSAALGRVVRDHYPLRNQDNVPRNTRIVVTFRQPIRLDSIAREQSGNNTLGDCVDATTLGRPLEWRRDCDAIIPSAIRIFRTGATSTLVEAALLAVPDADGQYRTIVMQPFEPIGSATGSVSYTVDLTRNIIAATGTASIFARDRSGHYEWQFETGTVLDLTPPYVTRVSPRHGGDAIPRNGIVQIDFSEPVDPTAVQGNAGTFSNIIFGANGNPSVLPTGSWQITNGYRSVEFISNVACGRNSCGQEMYCLPTTCVGANCGNNLTVLVRTAALLNVGGAPFAAVPFSGVMDLAGNALDSGSSSANPSLTNDGILANPHKPAVGANPLLIGGGERIPDNFWWNLSVSDVIDRTPPFVFDISPDIDAEGVIGDAPIEIIFGVPVRYTSLDGIALEEWPVVASADGTDTPPWFRSSVNTVGLGGAARSQIILNHRELGPQGSDRYYFVSIPSTVQSATQNCLYPGRGPVTETPGEQVQCTVTQDASGQLIVGPGCVPVQLSPAVDTGCVQTTQTQVNGVDQRLQPTVEACTTLLRTPGISPRQN